MDSTLLQELLQAQTKRYQQLGLDFSPALDAALRRLSHTAGASLRGKQALSLRAQLRAAARNLAADCETAPHSSTICLPVPTDLATTASRAART